MRRHSAISKCICRLFQLPKQDQSRKSRVGIRTRYSPLTISSRISDSPTPWWNPIVSRGRGRVKAKSFFSPSAYINVRANLLLPNCITTGSGMNHLSPAFFLVKVPRKITPPSFGHRGGSTFSGSGPGTYRGAWHGDRTSGCGISSGERPIRSRERNRASKSTLATSKRARRPAGISSGERTPAPRHPAECRELQRRTAKRASIPKTFKHPHVRALPSRQCFGVMLEHRRKTYVATTDHSVLDGDCLVMPEFERIGWNDRT